MKNKISKTSKMGALIGGTAVLATLALASSALAQTTASVGVSAQGRADRGGGMHRAPGVFGTVASVSGSTITVTSKNIVSGTAGSTYTVNAGSATVTKGGSASTVAAIAIGDTVMVQGTINGTSVTATQIRDGMMGNPGDMMGGRGQGTRGTVTSISGNTITLTSKAGPNGATATIYTINAANASVTKAGVASTLTSIAVGDTLMVQGTLSGTTVTATKINDGENADGPHGTGTAGPGAAASPTITGNGEPVIGGTVASISGTSLTITNKSNVTYTVNASSSTVNKAGATATLASVAVGDNVIVQGTVSGTAVVATSILDQGVVTAAPSTGSNATGNTIQTRSLGGLFGRIGSFFQHLFGF